MVFAKIEHGSLHTAETILKVYVEHVSLIANLNVCCHILDAAGLEITDPKALEAEINAWPGVVTVGLFATRGADVLLLGTQDGVVTSERE